MNKLFLLPLALIALCSCSDKSNADSTSSIAESDSLPQSSRWQLVSYRIDCHTEVADSASPSTLTLNPIDSTFSLTTDCNTIGGQFIAKADTVLFKNIMVTEMACEHMEREEAMLRMLNDTTGYAIQTGDTLRYNAPYIGTAIFTIHK